jgi:hypothetical protein
MIRLSMDEPRKLVHKVPFIARDRVCSIPGLMEVLRA